MIEVHHISGGYDQKQIVDDISFSVEKGQFIGVLGPNGSGKSTLLKLISGVLPVRSGDVLIEGKSLSSYKGKTLAKKLAVLPQVHEHGFTQTVKETVKLGRYPYQKGLFRTWSEEDERAVERALQHTGMKAFEEKAFAFLSGGEQQRTFIAQALAQQADVLLLDEPTNHLDLEHQRQILDLVKSESLARGLTVISIFHDVNLAALYCDEVLLMEKGRIRKKGTPAEVLTSEEIEHVYNTQVARMSHPHMPVPQMVLRPSLPKLTETLRQEAIQITANGVEFHAHQPLRTLSSALHNPGFGWYRSFLNRVVPHSYAEPLAQQEMKQFLTEHQFPLEETVAMMTAISPTEAVVKQFTHENINALLCVTAGVGNALDVSKAYEHPIKQHIGTINIWVLIEGHLTDEAFVQSMMTVVEAKTKALNDLAVRDHVTGTIATGTPTDSVLIAATQTGENHRYGGTMTPLGRLIGTRVYETICEALRKKMQ